MVCVHARVNGSRQANHTSKFNTYGPASNSWSPEVWPEAPGDAAAAGSWEELALGKGERKEGGGRGARGARGRRAVSGRRGGEAWGRCCCCCCWWFLGRADEGQLEGREMQERHEQEERQA